MRKIKTIITDENIKTCEQILKDNGIEKDKTDIVLQAIGYALLNIELYPEER